MAESKALIIRDAIIALVEPLQLDGQPAFVEVKGHPRGEFNGFPSVRVLPADQTSEKAAYGSTDKTVNLSVRTHVPTAEDGSEFDYMYKLTDLIMDALETADFRNLLPSQLDAFHLSASRGAWFDTDTQEGPVLACEIDVSVMYSQLV